MSALRRTVNLRASVDTEGQESAGKIKSRVDGSQSPGRDERAYHGISWILIRRHLNKQVDRRGQVQREGDPMIYQFKHRLRDDRCSRNGQQARGEKACRRNEASRRNEQQKQLSGEKVRIAALVVAKVGSDQADDDASQDQLQELEDPGRRTKIACVEQNRRGGGHRRRSPGNSHVVRHPAIVVLSYGTNPIRSANGATTHANARTDARGLTHKLRLEQLA